MVLRKTHRHQDWILPRRIEDLIDDDHVCYLVEIVIDDMDFSAIEEKYNGPGRPAYPPRIIIKVLIMGMIDGVRASRKLAKNVRENVVYMYLAEKLTPDFRTFCNFRKNNDELVDECFLAVVLYARELGMVQLNHISIDGSTFKANASKSKTFTKEELAFIHEFIKNEVEQGILEDERDDAILGKDNTGYELPDEVKCAKSIKKHLKKKLDESKINEMSKRRVKKLTEEYIDGDKGKKTDIEAKVASGLKTLEGSGSKRVNLTDPDSQLMKDKKGFYDQEFNGQIAVDSHEKIIIGSSVSSSPVDTNELIPIVENVEATVGELPEGTEMSLDNGYYSGENLKYLEDRNIDGHIPDGIQAQKMKGKTLQPNPFSKESFEYDEVNDCFTCPHGKILSPYYEYYDKAQKRTMWGYRSYECGDCPYRNECITEKGKSFKRIKADKYEGHRRRMRTKMETDAGRMIYKTRGATVEHPFGDIKANIGLRGFLTRGLSGVRTEFRLACIAHNFKRIASYLRRTYGSIKNFRTIGLA